MLLQIFAKAPHPGEVKTRLIPALGMEGACALYRRMLHHVLSQMTPVFRTQLWCAPDTTDAFFLACQATYNIELCTQVGDDLGERMQYALTQGLQTSDSVVLIGSDCPALNVDYVNLAFAALPAFDLVLGPAEDGGYVLIGAHHQVPDVFTNIAWSTPEVLAATRAQAERLQLRKHELALQWDVDEPADLVRLQRSEYDFLSPV